MLGESMENRADDCKGIQADAGRRVRSAGLGQTEGMFAVDADVGHGSISVLGQRGSALGFLLGLLLDQA